MLSSNRAILLLLIFLLNAGFAKSQSQYLLRKVYSLEKANGTVYIVAENHGSMPFTALIRAKLVNMRSNVPLPLRIVVSPGASTFLLATFTPTTSKDYVYKYTYHILDGVYTGHLPDTSYVYRLPYLVRGTSALPQKVTADDLVLRASTRYLYKMQLPIHTPICAARPGTIVAVKQEAKNERIINANLIFIMHDDGSYSSYENIGRRSAIGQVGRPVIAGDTIGYFEGNKRNPYFWFAVQYPADSLTTTVPVVFRAGQQLLRPH